jgi:thioesterase domain-containing protein
VSATAAAELQRKINRHIPLSNAMAYRIASLDDGQISVEAPLQPNSNIHGTGFAGSIYALGILTSWALCAHLIAQAGLEADLVVAEARIVYREPIRGDIVCRSALPPAQARAFIDDLVSQGRSRMTLQVAVGDGPAAEIEAVMHASLG